jgi:uncharacterized membrane protein YfhO
MYFPWLDYKWGFLVGVPVKNPLLTDVISQYYPWRDLAINIWRNWQIPLWNNFSFSGTPLLANWQSAVLYPLNILMIFFGKGAGWTIIIMLQPFLVMIFTYFYLREIKVSALSSIFGSILFAFSGFMMIFLEYNSPAQAAIWLPLILLIIERYIKNKNYLLLPTLSSVLFILLTAGNFQVTFFTILISFAYLCARLFKNFKTIAWVTLFYILGAALAALQLLPTLELFSNSIRNSDNNIILYNYGLMPLKNFIIFFAPDFFGNPVTQNGRGFIYQETAGYFGALTIPFILANIFKKKNFYIIFFGIVFAVSVLLIFDTPVGRLIYQLKVPMLSTSYASRALFLTNFSGAILAAFGLEALKEKFKYIFATGVLIFAALSGLFAYIYAQIHYLHKGNIVDLSISSRNLILPIALTFVFLVSLKFIRNLKILSVVIIIILACDLFRFGLKYNPFVPARLLYPNSPVTEFLQKNMSNYRIDHEKVNIFPANTWIPYGLMSASGYDPLYSYQYANYYGVYNGNKPGSLISRYAELDNPNSPFLDLAGVKYLVVAKKDNHDVIDKISNNISYKISPTKYKRVFEDTVTLVLENLTVMPRVMQYGKYDVRANYMDAQTLLHNDYDFRNKIILNSNPGLVPSSVNPNDKVAITDYSSNSVSIRSVSAGNTIVMLTDAYYPGWIAKIDGVNTKLYIADGIYRAVAVPAGTHEIIFEFKPKSFKYGLLITFCASLILEGYIILKRKKSP